MHRRGACHDHDVYHRPTRRDVMTAAPDWDIVGPRNTDAELVCGCVAGDRNAFAQIYDRYADRLHDFCVGMLRDRDRAADCVQETFCVAATRLPQLRDPDKLRSWLYAIARNEALRLLRERRRETPTDDLPDSQSPEAGLDTLAARTELADLVADAAGGLSDRDRSVLELSYRHGLDGPELAEALGVSLSNANKIVYRLRETIATSLGALLVSRRARSTPDGCPELTSILDGWNGQFTVLWRKRISRHTESCPTCDEERRRLVSPAALLGTAPIFVPAPEWLRESTMREVELTSHSVPAVGQSVDAGAPSSDDVAAHRRTRNWGLPVVLVLVVLGVAIGVTLAWVNRGPDLISPTEISGQTATSSKPLPTPTAPPAAIVLPPSQPPVVQTPGSLTPSTPPAIEPPVYTRTPESEPTPELLPPDPPTPPDSGPPLWRRPPMSFSPPVVVTPVVPPPNSGGNGDSDSDPPGPGRPGVRG